MVDAVNVYLNANDNSVLKYKPKLGEAPEVLRELSGDAVGWLTIDDTKIDYPVMQGKTNDTYINRDPYGQFSLSGSIFLDSRNSADFSDEFSLIYGHHMEYGAMFGSLDEYADREYLRAHSTGNLTTKSGKEFSLTVFASCKLLASDELIFNPTEGSKEALLQFLEQNALAYELNNEDRNYQVLALSTCQGADTIERMVVFCALREINPNQ